MFPVTPVELANGLPPMPPIDPQVVTQAADQTWEDYNPIPGSPYADPSIEPTIERFNVALILTDFPDTLIAARDAIRSKQVGAIELTLGKPSA